ncbi:glycosyltransferase family 4 protein [Cetobacterium sp.]|uniref:glycosyltransferase family 4 protein n=1 Tax=Cetobacterium sp. TaxID=2071632 RepID=UPI003F2CD32B
MKKILMIGPFPGSLNGQTIANQTAYEGLKASHNIDRINTLKENDFTDKSTQGKFILSKFFRIMKEILSEIKQIVEENYDVVYMTSGQSFLGFMRFSPYMLACIIKKIPYYNHIHGGHFRKMYNSQSSFKQKLLNFFIKKSTGMIVLGNSLRSMFEGIMPEDKIYVCENGVQDDVVATEDEIKEKIERYKNDTKKRVLYLSNLMEEKGILDLLKASEKFNDDEIEFNLAGAIEPSIKDKVEDYLRKYPNKIKYHGMVRGEQKKKLLLENYVFILPTYYSNEGQPISILEAYATGCAVITDESIGGIKDIFQNNINGISIRNRDDEDISSKIKNISESEFFQKNYEEVKQKYKKIFFIKKIENIFLF